jgi:hypothetical protein
MVGRADRKPKVGPPGHVVFLFRDERQRQATTALVLGGGWPMILDEKKVHEMALEVSNPRMDREEQRATLELPRLQYVKDFKRRALFNGPLTFLETKAVVREHLTWGHWQVTYYEVVQFPHTRYFKDEAEAMEFFRKATEERGGLRPRRMEVYRPKAELFGKREAAIEWKMEGYRPDQMTRHYR